MVTFTWHFMPNALITLDLQTAEKVMTWGGYLTGSSGWDCPLPFVEFQLHITSYGSLSNFYFHDMTLCTVCRIYSPSLSVLQNSLRISGLFYRFKREVLKCRAPAPQSSLHDVNYCHSFILGCSVSTSFTHLEIVAEDTGQCGFLMDINSGR